LARTKYVDNKLFYKALVTYLKYIKPLKKQHDQLCDFYISLGLPKNECPKFARPQTPEYQYIGEVFLKMATHIASKGNFSGYSFKEDMVGDAIQNVIQYLENFDPKKSHNPFAYFTQIIIYAFIRKIAKEGVHSYIKQKSLESAIDFFSTQGGDDGDYVNTYTKFIREAKNDIIVNFETKKANKQLSTMRSKKLDRPGIDKFLVSV
jgi:DNA-directed RNA polymerase specialized sigma subunit